MADIYEEMKRMQEEMALLFREFFHYEHSYSLEGIQGYRPPINVYYNDKNIVVILELAGVDKDSFVINVSEKLLVIKGERKDPFKEDPKNYYVVEIYFGRFEKRIHLPFLVEKNKVKTKFENGLVKITLQRKKKKEKIIPIK